MNPIYTPASSIDKRNRGEVTRWVADILSIDYRTRRIDVNIKGASGPRNIIIPMSLDMGHADAPLIFPGNRAIIERIDDQYIVTNFLVQPGKSAGTSGGNSTLLPP